MTVLDVIAGLMVLAAFGNAYFVRDGWRWFRSVTPRSPILFALLGVKVTVWAFGVYFAIVAARFLTDQPEVLPWGGVGLAVVIFAIELLPLFIWFQMRSFVDDELDRDEERNAIRDPARDDARDEVRDPVRDDVRDAARDEEHDQAEP